MHSWRIPPLTGAVTGGGIVGATGVNSQMLLLRSGLELVARVSPHIGGVDINEDIEGI